jgi:sugar lactone lactonase YvrE
MSDTEIPPYEVTTGWADLAPVPDASSAWAHNGLVATSSGELIGFHAGQLVAFDPHGQVRRVISQGLTEGHGITLVREDGQEYLWISDPGFLFACTTDDGDEALAPMFGKGLHHHASDPRVVKLTLAGEICVELAVPAPNPSYPPGPMGPYCPCGTAVDEQRFGGSGDIWVADGYGSSLVHRFDRTGRHLSTISGEEGAGRFNCPHAVYIDRRGGKTPELYIADRGNKRVQVYDLDDRYLRTFGDRFLNSPSGFAQWGDLLVIAELFSRLAALDSDDNLIGYIGADPDADPQPDWPRRPGWPNTLADNGRAVPPQPDPDRFNSPHSLAVDAEGNLYVSEWLIGGRYTKLKSVPPDVPTQREKP